MVRKTSFWVSKISWICNYVDQLDQKYRFFTDAKHIFWANSKFFASKLFFIQALNMVVPRHSQLFWKNTVRKNPINSKKNWTGLKPWHIKEYHKIHPNHQKNGQVPDFLMRKSTFYIYYASTHPLLLLPCWTRAL